MGELSSGSRWGKTMQIWQDAGVKMEGEGVKLVEPRKWNQQGCRDDVVRQGERNGRDVR